MSLISPFVHLRIFTQFDRNWSSSSQLIRTRELWLPNSQSVRTMSYSSLYPWQGVLKEYHIESSVYGAFISWDWSWNPEWQSDSPTGMPRCNLGFSESSTVSCPLESGPSKLLLGKETPVYKTLWHVRCCGRWFQPAISFYSSKNKICQIDIMNSTLWKRKCAESHMADEWWRLNQNWGLLDVCSDWNGARGGGPGGLTMSWFLIWMWAAQERTSVCKNSSPYTWASCTRLWVLLFSDEVDKQIQVCLVCKLMLSIISSYFLKIRA